MTVSQIYETTIKPLPEAERQELATLILADMPSPPVTDNGGEWSEEDYQDFSRATWNHIEQQLQKEENAQAA